MLFSGLRGCRGAAPAPQYGGRQCRGRLFLLRRTWQMSRRANLLSQPLNSGFCFCSCCDGASARGESRKKVMRKQYSLYETRKFCSAKQFLFDSGRSRPPPKPPAVLIGSGGFAPRTPIGHPTPERCGVYPDKQQFTAILPFG